MRQSHMFLKTKKDAPSGEVAKNAQLLIRAGFVHKEMAGVYTYLPLGLRVIERIKEVVREELNAIGSEELSMTVLQQAEAWQATNRWSDEVVDNWFKTKLKNDTELGLAFTHEEPITNIMKNFIFSHKDLPALAYQFQTKFRNELRAKSGIMRGREFLMKDLYSFHKNEADHLAFYEHMKEVYMKIFTRLGLGDSTFLTLSNGGSFSKYSYEFQTISEAGEDTIMLDRAKGFAINKEDYSSDIFADFGLNESDYTFEEVPSIELGDIYTLGTKYAEAIGLTYTSEDEQNIPVFMGSYGIGISRVMGTIVEVFADDKGLVWPAAVAPYHVHLISLLGDDNAPGDELYEALKGAGVDVLYDDRDMRAGQKFADSDLIGIPTRVTIGKRSVASGTYEVTDRATGDMQMMNKETLLAAVTK
jgi:prolyl-tRNA synthetase